MTTATTTPERGRSLALPFRKAHILRRGRRAGLLEETANGFRFSYASAYLADQDQPPVSLTLPKRAAPYESGTLFPCFQSLLAEGALAQEQCRHLRLDERDLMGRLLATLSHDAIGSLRVAEAKEEVAEDVGEKSKGGAQ